jgi:hypothetical protein
MAPRDPNDEPGMAPQTPLQFKADEAKTTARRLLTVKQVLAADANLRAKHADQLLPPEC